METTRYFEGSDIHVFGCLSAPWFVDLARRRLLGVSTVAWDVARRLVLPLYLVSTDEPLASNLRSHSTAPQAEERWLPDISSGPRFLDLHRPPYSCSGTRHRRPQNPPALRLNRHRSLLCPHLPLRPMAHPVEARRTHLYCSSLPWDLASSLRTYGSLLVSNTASGTINATDERERRRRESRSIW